MHFLLALYSRLLRRHTLSLLVQTVGFCTEFFSEENGALHPVEYPAYV